MLNCHQATRLMSEAQERSLKTGEKLSLRFHTMMCAACRRFGSQMDFLRRSAREYISRPDARSGVDQEKTNDSKD